VTLHGFRKAEDEDKVVTVTKPRAAKWCRRVQKELNTLSVCGLHGATEAVCTWWRRQNSCPCQKPNALPPSPPHIYLLHLRHLSPSMCHKHNVWQSISIGTF